MRVAAEEVFGTPPLGVMGVTDRENLIFGHDVSRLKRWLRPAASCALRHAISRRMPSSIETSGFQPSIFSALARLKSSCLVTLERTLEVAAL